MRYSLHVLCEQEHLVFSQAGHNSCWVARIVV